MSRSTEYPQLPIPGDQLHTTNELSLEAHTDPMAEDPFECRLAFTKLLGRLNASSAAVNHCTHFALKNKELEEDLFSVVLEQLQSKETSMNMRVNMLYFIEHLCEVSVKVEYEGYIKMVRRDLLQIVDCVVPDDPDSASNISAMRKVVIDLNQKSLIDDEALETVFAMLDEREQELRLARASPAESIYDDSSDGNPHKRSKLQEQLIMQRMDEDRERHKQLRQNIWAVPLPRAAGHNPEFEKMWEEASELGEEDFEIMREENAILKASLGE
ncbi:hypothetical protein RUND412_007363 [Rhizina undulata]